MRCAPIAIRWLDDPVALVRNSIVSAVPTHWDRRCGWSCALLNLAAAAALRGESIATDDLLHIGLESVRVSLPELQMYGYEARVPDSVRGAVLEAAEAEIAETHAAPAPTTCPDCGGAVEVTGGASQCQEDLPEVRPLVRRFDIEVGHCSQCQRRVLAISRN